MEEYMEDTVSLKIKQAEVPAQVLMYLKKQTGDSLSALQAKLRNHDFIITLDYCELGSFRQINAMRAYLMEQGITVDLYMDDMIMSPEYFINLEERYREYEEEMREQGFFF